MTHRVGVVVAMPSEMAPLRTVAALRPDAGDGHRYVGTVGPADVVAVTSGIGTARAALATERLLATGSVQRVVMMGICGGVDLDIGAIVVPAVVVDGSTGAEHRPAPLTTRQGVGVLWTSDSLTGSDDLNWLRDRGVTAVDMETAAVAGVCEAAGVPWSVIRSVSDAVGRTGADEAILGLARPDGTPDLGAVARYLGAKPWRVGRLATLARGARLASKAAAEALHAELVAAHA